MKHRLSFWQTKQGNSVKYGISLFLPYILFAIALVFLSIFLYRNVISRSVYYQLILNSTSINEEKPTVSTDGESFPGIPYLSQWATVNVDGWESNTDIPAFFGNEEEVLKNGAAAPSYTNFCGQGGKIILSAHVTRHFSELEDTEIGTLISVDTVYGPYIYKVEEKVIFEAKDAAAYISPDNTAETLVLYTCYPRENNFKTRTQRCALICTKVSGKVW